MSAIKIVEESYRRMNTNDYRFASQWRSGVTPGGGFSGSKIGGVAPLMYNLAMHLRQVIQSKANAWRKAGYPGSPYPAVAEILEYTTIPLDDGRVQWRTLRAAVKIIDMLDEEMLATATV